MTVPSITTEDTREHRPGNDPLNRLRPNPPIHSESKKESLGILEATMAHAIPSNSYPFLIMWGSHHEKNNTRHITPSDDRLYEE